MTTAENVAVYDVEGTKRGGCSNLQRSKTCLWLPWYPRWLPWWTTLDQLNRKKPPTATTKLLAAIAALLFASVLAEDPNNCDTKNKTRDGSAFVLHEKPDPDNPNVTSLAKILSDRHTIVAQVFEDGNRKMTKSPLDALVWQEGEYNTPDWIP